MSHDHDKRNNKQQIPQHKLGTALRSFFDHVTSHDEEGVHAALCMVANAAPQDPNAPTEINGVPVMPAHICNFGAGNPDALAQMVIMAIDTMIEEVPGFAEAWEDALRDKYLQAKEQAAEAKGMEAVKPQADELIARAKGNDTKH